MSLERFVSLLKTESLFFARADCFRDKYEGSYPKLEIEHHRVESERITNLSNKGNNDLEIQKNIQASSDFAKRMRKLTLINCWHYNESESFAMWDLYSENGKGIAIQSKINLLKESLHDTDFDIRIGKVRYLDYKKDIFYNKDEFPHYNRNAMTPFVHKRKAFIHENEYRAMFSVKPENGWDYDWSKEIFEKGRLVKTNIDLLLEKILTYPDCSDEFFDTVSIVLEKFLPQKNVYRSELEEEALF